MADSISSLLRQSFGHLAAEVPASYRRLLDTLGPMVVELDVDGELFSLRGGDRLEVREGEAPAADTFIATSRTTMLDVLDAKVGLATAVEAGTVAVRGSLDDVQRAHDTLLAFVHAAVRAPSQPALLQSLRNGLP